MGKNQKRKGQKPKKGNREEPSLETPEMEDTSEIMDFEDEDSDAEFEKDTRKLVQQQNRKKKKSGGFQSMGLSHSVYTGVMRKGYKVPTPIQRKTIPLLLDGKDVVAMARTGSGKTAAFLIPMFEKLKAHSAKAGARALVLSPTRELALQTLKFTKELGRFTGLKAAVILGGDKMEEQFAALHENPDIIIATPGRFMHVMVEMDLKLQHVEYVVFDEADRLFEMGFQEQLQEILTRLPESRQTLLFSATLPKLLVDFAKAGLHDPTLIRLDVDSKLSEQLKLSFLHCRAEDKTAVLLHFLRNVITPAEQTVIFVATKHHVEYLNMILQEAGISCSHSYSSLDQTARKINVAKFRTKKTMVLIVTDLAARGIDIPMLDNVINYNFPAKPKLFVHRVGRVARAGQSGTAYSFVSPDEMAYVLDLHLFLGRTINFAHKESDKSEDGLYGRVPQSVIDDEVEKLRLWHSKIDLENMKKVIDNAYKQYVKSRPAPANESIKRVKEISETDIGFHPILHSGDANTEDQRNQLLEAMKSFRPNTTIFEINSNNKTQAFEVMKKKRNWHGQAIQETSQKRQEKKNNLLNLSQKKNPSAQTLSSDTDIQEAFSKVIKPKHHDLDEPQKKKKKKIPTRDEENFLSYRPKDYQTEKGYTLGTKSSFEQDAANAVLDFTGDDDQTSRKIKGQMKWDRKKKKFVKDMGQDGGKRKVKTESGTWVSATYKSNLYKDWLDKSKASHNDEDGDESGEESTSKKPKPGRFQVIGGGRGKGRGFHQRQKRDESVGNRKELKNKDQIIKERKRKAKLQSFMKHKHQKKQKKQAMRGGGGGSRGRGGGNRRKR